MKLASSPICNCGLEDQIAEHILQRCPLLQTARTNVWPTAVQLPPNCTAARRNWRRQLHSSCRLDSQCSGDREVEEEPAHDRFIMRRRVRSFKGRINPCTPYRMCCPAWGCSCRHTRRDPCCPCHTLRGPHRARTCSCVPFLQVLSLHNTFNEHDVFHLLHSSTIDGDFVLFGLFIYCFCFLLFLIA